MDGEAPEALKELPHPDRVFIGGSGGRLREILEFLEKRGVGFLVATAATLETLNLMVGFLSLRGYQYEVAQIMVSKGTAISNSLFFKAENPVFVIRGERP